MRHVAIFAAILAALLAPAPPAFAQGAVNAPPGNSGIGQYLEVVPGATGNRPTRGTVASKARAPLTVRQRRALERLGGDGRDLLRFIAATAPSAPGRRGDSLTAGRGAPNGSTGAVPSAKAQRRSGRTAAKIHAKGLATALANSLTGGEGGGGMGAALPVLMAVSVLLVVLARRRRARAPDA